MSTLDYFAVDSPDPIGATSYKKIASTIISDHNLLKILSRLRIFVDPKVPMFIAVGLTRTVLHKITISDLAGVLIQDQKIILSIGDETYLADLLEILWRQFGRDAITQPDRFTIEIRLEDEISLHDIEQIVVTDPTEGIFKDLVYSMQIICPEGFRVKKQFFHEGRFWFIASENALPEDVIPLVEEQFTIMGESS